MTPLEFSETTTLLNVQNEKTSCFDLPHTSMRRKARTLQCSQCALVLFSAVALGYSIYDTVTTFHAKPLSRRNSTYAVLELAASTMVSVFSACFVAVPHCINHYARKLYPHASSNQTSSITQAIYFDQDKDLEHIERWKPHVSALLSHFQPMPFFEHWLKAAKYNTTEEAVEAMSRRLKRGTCYGYSMALLAIIQKSPKSPSEELLNHVQLETVVAYQLLQSIIVDCINSKEAKLDWTLCLLMSNDPDEERDYKEQYNHGKWNSKNWVFLRALKADLERYKYWENEDYLKMPDSDNNKLGEIFQAGMTEITKGGNETLIIAGVISLRESEENQLKNENAVGHALFFQCSNGYFRFHDSGSILKGFFEFDSQESLLENLLKHIKTWSMFKDGQVKFTFLGIPHSDDNGD